MITPDVEKIIQSVLKAAQVAVGALPPPPRGFAVTVSAQLPEGVVIELTIKRPA